MSKYDLHISTKTRFLNKLRLPFTIGVFEKMLLAFTLHSKSNFWIRIIPPHYLYKKKSLRTVVRRGFKVELDLSDMFDHSVYFREYDPSFDNIIPELHTDSLIVDVGANIGYTALLFASHAKNSAVFAFEPHPDTFKKAQKNISLNSQLSIELLNMGLGSKKDKLKLSEVNETNSGMNRILPEGSGSGFNSRQVEVDRLDDVLKSKKVAKVDLIKIDVEGYEAQVMAGAMQTLSNCKPVLMMELDDNNLKDNLSSAAEIIKTLRSLGYNQILNSATREIVTDKTDLTNCHWDIICKAV